MKSPPPPLSLSLRKALHTFILGICCGITAILVYLLATGNLPWMRAAGVGTGAPDVNARYLDGYGTAITTSAASKVLVTDGSGYLPDNSVDTGAIVDGQVTNDDLANNSVDSRAIANNSVDSGAIIDGQVTNDDLASGISVDVLRGLSITRKDVTFCKTSSSYTGNLGGRSGADAKCASQCGTGYVFATFGALEALAGTARYRFESSWGNDLRILKYTYQSSCNSGMAWIDDGTANCNDWTAASTYSGRITQTNDCRGTTDFVDCDAYKKILCVKEEINP